MKTKNQTKKALLMSAMSLLLCFSMLIGTTFAWFTDSVSTTNNIIVAGNLDIELYYATAEDVVNGQIPDNAWKKVSGNTNVFKDNLWEPGHTEVVYLKVVNEGTLSLKYHLGVNVESEITSTNVAGESFKLSDHIKYGVLSGAKIFTRDDAVAEVKDNATKLNQAYNSGTIKLDPKTATNTDNEDIVTMVVYMPTSVGNEANYKKGDDIPAPKIHLGINLFATQVEAEEDSYGPDYDKDSWKIVYDEKGLRGAIASGEKNIKLGGPITLTAPLVIPSSQTIRLSTRSVSFDGIVLDMGGFELTMAAGVDAPVIINEGELQIQNGEVEGDVVNEGKLYIEESDVAGTIDTTEGKAFTMDGDTTVGTIIVKDEEAAAAIIDNNVGASFTGIAIPSDSSSTGYVEVEVENLPTKNTVVVEKDDEGNDTITVVPAGAENPTEDEGIYISGNIYYITSLTGLKNFAANVNGGNAYKGKTVVLGADIDLKNEEWTPIGNSTTSFQGTFDGNGKTISNLNVNMPGKSNVGFFGMTTDGTIKNLTIENAKIVGRLNVGVVAGTPYTSKYSDITVTGHVEVDGMAYVGGVGGKNAYADWTDIKVLVDETSYVKANSVENGTAYRTYVGGVVGFNGEGGHTFKNITSNIDVYGSTCDIGGAFGIAHYGNKFENITVTGNVTGADGVYEIGGIAGVWHNENGTTVTFTNCAYNGASNVSIVGSAYNADGTGKLIVDGVEVAASKATLQAQLDKNATNIEIVCDITGDVTVTQKEGVNVVINGNGNKFDGTIYIYGQARHDGKETLTIKNINFASDEAKDFISSNSTESDKRYAHNVTVENCSFTGAEGYVSVGMRYRQTYNMKVINCTATNLHSLMQTTGGVGITVSEVTLNACKNGMSFGTTDNVVVKDSTINSVGDYGYGVRVNAEGAYNLTVEGCTINAEAPVLLRKATGAYTATLTNNTLVSDNGYRILTTAADYEEGTKLTAATGTLNITVDGCAYVLVTTADELIAALENGKNVILANNIKIDPANMSNAYGKTGINVKEGQTLDGNGYTLDVRGAGGTWDSGICTNGGCVVKNITISGAFRGIFIKGGKDKVILDNVTTSGTVYTISCDQATYQGLEATNCTFNGWSSFAATLGDAKFVNCNFGEGSGYKFLRPYAATEFINCNFGYNTDGYKVDPVAKVTMEGCTIKGVAVTAENLDSFVISDVGSIDNVTVK